MDALTVSAAKKAATKYNVPLANVLAVVDVESNGVIYAKVDGQNEPVIRWEGHYFHKRLKGAALQRAIAQGLASPRVGGVKNPNSQQARWDKLLKPAMVLDKGAAIESVSWGVGQVMGAHWKVLKFPTPTALYEAAREGVDGQIDLMMRYVKEFGLIDEMQRGDFLGFARGYNGKGQQGYDSRMKKAAQRYSRDHSTAREEDKSVDGVPVNSIKRAENAETMLRLGVAGPEVRELQKLLLRAGYAIEIDGDYGPATKQAVLEFQKASGLEEDGIAGPITLKALDIYKVDPTERLGAVGAAETFVKTPEGRQGAATAGAGTIITGALEPAKSALEPLVGQSTFIDTVYTVLTIGGVAVIVLGLAWAGYGWWRANSTRGMKEAA